MPVYPLLLQPLVKDGDYPHMQSRDVEIWERWIDAYGGNFPRGAYDVALGGVVIDSPGAEESIIRAYRYATAVKVDAVVVSDERALAIEVKPRASLGAIGQALGAAALLEADQSVNVEIFPAVVTDRMLPDARFVADELGVLVFEVGEATPPGERFVSPEFPRQRLAREAALPDVVPLTERELTEPAS